MFRVWFSLVLSLIAAAATGQAVASDVGKDPRPLTPSEVGTFLPLICINPVRLPENVQKIHDIIVGPKKEPDYALGLFAGVGFNCAQLPGYPDAHPASPGGAVTLTAIAYGAFSKVGADEAYVSYEGVEGHAGGGGGGILFARTRGEWRRVAWFPGNRIENCLALPAAQPEEMLCLASDSWSEEGFEDISARPTPVLPGGDAGNGINAKSYYTLSHSVFSGRWHSHYDNCKDLHENAIHIPDEENACPAHEKGAGFLDEITGLERSSHPGAFAEATVTYIRPDDIDRACAQTCFLDAPRRAGKIYFRLQGPTIRVDMPEGLNLQPEKSDM